MSRKRPLIVDGSMMPATDEPTTFAAGWQVAAGGTTVDGLLSVGFRSYIAMQVGADIIAAECHDGGPRCGGSRLIGVLLRFAARQDAARRHVGLSRCGEVATFVAAPQHQLRAGRDIGGIGAPCRAHPPFLVLIQAQHRAMRRRPDVEGHLKRAIGVERVLLLESFVIAVRLRDRDVHVDAPCRAIRVGFGGDPDHTVRRSTAWPMCRRSRGFH